MNDSDAVLFVFFCWIVWAVLGGICGHFRGRPGSGIVWGLLFGPIGVAITLWALDDLRPHCEACTKAIPAGAIRCPCCGSHQSQVAVWKQPYQIDIPTTILVLACLFAFLGLMAALGALASGGILAGSIGILICALIVGAAIANLYASRSRKRINFPAQPIAAETVYEHHPRSSNDSKSPERQPPPPPAPPSSTMDKISVVCPCGAKFVTPASWIGKQAKCRECGTVFLVKQSPIPSPRS